MKSIAFNHLGNVSDAEDAVQETFLKIHRAATRLHRRGVVQHLDVPHPHQHLLRRICAGASGAAKKSPIDDTPLERTAGSRRRRETDDAAQAPRRAPRTAPHRLHPLRDRRAQRTRRSPRSSASPKGTPSGFSSRPRNSSRKCGKSPMTITCETTRRPSARRR